MKSRRSELSPFWHVPGPPPLISAVLGVGLSERSRRLLRRDSLPEDAARSSQLAALFGGRRESAAERRARRREAPPRAAAN